jgi:hypothetical protein
MVKFNVPFPCIGFSSRVEFKIFLFSLTKRLVRVVVKI